MSVLNASSMPITHSAIGSSKTPRAFVTTTSLSTSSGKSRPSTPADAVWIQRTRPRLGHAAASSVRSPSQKYTASASAPAAASSMPAAYRSRTSPSAASMPGGGSAASPSTTTSGASVTAAAGR